MCAAATQASECSDAGGAWRRDVKDTKAFALESRPRVLAESQGFAWDPGLGPMVLASNGGAVAAGEVHFGLAATATAG